MMPPVTQEEVLPVKAEEAQPQSQQQGDQRDEKFDPVEPNDGSSKDDTKDEDAAAMGDDDLPEDTNADDSAAEDAP